MDPVDLPADVRPRSRLPGQDPRQLLPLLQGRSLQRGLPGWQVRHLPLRRRPEVQGRLVPAHHRVCRQAARRPRHRRLPAEHPSSAGQLDRQVHRRIRQLPREGHRRRDASHLYDPSRHPLRRHLHGHGARAPDDRQVCRPDRQHGRHRSIPQRVREEDRV